MATYFVTFNAFDGTAKLPVETLIKAVSAKQAEEKALDLMLCMDELGLRTRTLEITTERTLKRSLLEGLKCFMRVNPANFEATGLFMVFGKPHVLISSAKHTTLKISQKTLDS